MEIISFISGLALGIISLSMKRLKILLKIILSICTSYLFVLTINPDFKLWSIDELSWNNLLFKFNYWEIGVLGVLISMGIFYFLIPFLLKRIIRNRIKIRYNLYMKNKQNNTSRNIKILIYKTIRFIIKYSFYFGYVPNRHSNLKEKFKIFDYLNDLIGTISIISHLAVCLIFVIDTINNLFGILSISVTLVLLINTLLIPHLYFIFEYSNKVFNHELNRHIQSIS